MEKDSMAMQHLEEVVLTGQINKQSVDKSVFEVKVIPRETMDRLAGNTLADVLNQSLNISIQPNPSTGKSSVELFGLDGQYFKILVDNIPLINDEGLGNNTDLTQINLDDIEQVEIVEGSMGVQYGSNAVSGIINIITRKDSDYQWEITPYVQEETIGNEYGFFDQGRHIQSLTVGHRFSEKWYINGNITHNDFTGHLNNREGEFHTLNDGRRGFEWLPKTQYSGKALVNYSGKNFRSFYRMEYFNERVQRYDSVVRENYNPSTQTSNPTATDAEFTSQRFYNHFNMAGKFVKTINYDISASYQQQKRDVEQYNYRINSREKFDVDSQEYESRKGIYSRGTFNDFFQSEKTSLQLGYELSNIKGYSSSLAGTFSGNSIDRRLEAYDAFATAEFDFGKRFSLRPGTRAMFSSQFKTQMAHSLSAKYAFDNGYQLRAVLGTSPRNPNFDELFTYFVDVNHDVRGNINLSPERGISSFLHLKKNFFPEDLSWRLSSKISAWYLNVDDRIELTIVNPSPLAFQYNNIDEYRNWGASFTNKVVYGDFQFDLGLSFSGESKVLNSEESFNDDYLYALQVSSNVGYQIPKINTTVSLFFKYNGPEYQFILDTNQDDPSFIRSKREGYGWMDGSIRKTFMDNKLHLTLGARNLLDITRINTSTVSSGGVHSSPNNGLLLGYGRSFFVKLLYNLNI
ncbi:TonB-dependent receptor plug domain-containing protein [Allomuricauda sp. CAU 1633]|uniref:TonB-dependent receptor plug domain-containing protein n=1 Tax=Allomuricauda sp. CAU 1633 TaxID=2816036 RepID=UPI001F5CCB13|nr:TonB-dependent receptor plug domain-containing protein [Muricauda sp. CAU 1633]